MSKQKFAEVEARVFSRVFICMKCGGKIRGDTMKVKDGKVKCRKCHSKRLRPVRKDRK